MTSAFEIYIWIYSRNPFRNSHNTTNEYMIFIFSLYIVVDYNHVILVWIS